MGGKCPLELLQQTCASIGRESPSQSEPGSGNPTSGKKRKLEKSPEKSTEAPVATKQPKTMKEDINQNKYVIKAENEEMTVAKLAKMSPERKSSQSPKTSPPLQKSQLRPAKSTQPSAVTSTLPSKAPKTSPVGTPAVPGLGGMSQLAMLNPSSLLHNAEIDRNLRAYASFYSASAASAAALQHPLSSSYPASGSFIPGLLPSFPYMSYFPGYPQPSTTALSGLFPSLQSQTSPEAMAAQMAQLAAMSQQHVTQQAEQAAAAYESALLQAKNAETSSSTERVCNWAGCGKKFATPERLAEHVKEHINTSTTATTTSGSTSAPADSTTGSATTPTELAKVPSTLPPRFNPYGALSSYPRDLLNSRFVYS